MATKFGRIAANESSFTEQNFNKGQTLTSASTGVHHYVAIHDDRINKQDPTIGLLSTSGSHWAFIHSMFYLSGSQYVNSDEQEKFNSYHHKFNTHNDLKPFYNHKFNDTASVFYIPQQYFGERIQPGSFTLAARTGSMTNTTKQILIKDDKNGNLYSTNAHHSQSSEFYISGIDTASGDHLSSSANYVGNVLYDLGIVTLTETGSWSGSVNYPDIGKKVGNPNRDYRYWTLAFNSTTPIFTSQYSIKIPAGEFNRTMNASTKPYGHAEFIPPGNNAKGNPFGIDDVAQTRTELTTGSFAPYFTQIHLYRDTDEEPVMIATVPRPIQVRDDIDLIITFRVDH
tara:strand:- start:233 stop:1255 length:1023 start_codon:yes stop_codon:yes gene_type:complete